MRRMEDGYMHRRMQKSRHMQGNDLDTPTKLYRGHEEQFVDILPVLSLSECRGVMQCLGFGDDTVSNVLNFIDFGEDLLSVSLVPR